MFTLNPNETAADILSQIPDGKELREAKTVIHRQHMKFGDLLTATPIDSYEIIQQMGEGE